MLVGARGFVFGVRHARRIGSRDDLAMSDPELVRLHMELLNQILNHLEQLYWLLIVQLTLSFVTAYVVIPRRGRDWRIGEADK